MAVHVRIEVDNRLVNRLLRSPVGPVARNMFTRGNRVRDRARRNVNSRSGALARSITVETVVHRGSTGVRVGTNLHYARFVHDGTGIYGPSRRPIRPRRAQVLAFSGRGTGTIFVRQTTGQRPNPFLREALRAAR